MLLLKKNKSFFSRSDVRFLDRVSNGVTFENTFRYIKIGFIIGTIIGATLVICAALNIRF
jgi:hypothetical protein